MRQTIIQLSWFIVVGCLAALTHWSMVITFVNLAHWSPIYANIAGWLIAFVVSFTGHYFLTFKHQGEHWTKPLKRFFCVSALGFLVNELSYVVLLKITTISYDILLAIILIVMAFITFLLSRFWAFKTKH